MKLKEIFQIQKKLQRQFDAKKNIEEREFPIDSPLEFRNALFSLVVEIGEAAKEDERWKDWKNHPNYNKNKKLVELVDCLYFLINAFLYAGFDFKDVEEAYIDKLLINIKKAKSDY